MTEERSTVEILKAARERISDPERWTTRVGARDQAGDATLVLDPNACKWCALGSIEAETNGPGVLYAEASAALFLGTQNEYGVVGTNDHLGHDAVLAMYDRAIQLAEQEAMA